MNNLLNKLIYFEHEGKCIVGYLVDFDKDNIKIKVNDEIRTYPQSIINPVK
jgi:hypothetical protein